MLKHSSSNRARDMVAPQEVREDAAIVCYIYANCVTKLSFLFNFFCSFVVVSFIIVGSYLKVRSIRHCAPTHRVSQRSVFSTITYKSLRIRKIKDKKKDLSGFSELRKTLLFEIFSRSFNSDSTLLHVNFCHFLPKYKNRLGKGD